MPSFCWKIKALKSNGPIAQGMEVEVIKQNKTQQVDQRKMKFEMLLI
ncbi:hypothetical protein [Plebeiibacterium marinum]|uniref:Uncharacterized protein n=1 Tax=Plebeiibacterium marinum TaxID=2992111 RepID=A0AAE3MDE2_9BACT|nr:hypothetical protein [Plebeiobacterium marinum]MCW3805738.1 hypothetical protein [Plebeiobacterium marinum]